MKRRFPDPRTVSFAVLAAVVLCASIWKPKDTPSVRNAEIRPSAPVQTAVVSENAETTSLPQEDMIGVWVPYMTLADHDGTQAGFCQKIDTITRTAAARGFNALFVHVRPFGDALYASDLYPWSHILTGTQGEDPGYDPLEYMVQAAHRAGLQLHAWINPLRISLQTTPAAFSPDNPYLLWQADDRKDCFLRCESGLYYDPAYPAVRTHITEGILEIVCNYDVDGIHFDDYFYPPEITKEDDVSYAQYCASISETAQPMPRDEWRRANINALVSQVYAAVKCEDPTVRFGISPMGVVDNNRSVFADAAAWCGVSGYVDYICPQLYYCTEDVKVTFSSALEQWCALPRAPGVELYIGLAAYKVGSDADNGAWQGKEGVLSREIVTAQERGAAGFVFYAWDQVVSQQASAEVEQALAVLL